MTTRNQQALKHHAVVLTLCKAGSIIIAVIFAFAMLFVPFSANLAWGDDNAELMAKVKSLRAMIDSARTEYLVTIQYSEELASQCQVAEAELAEIEKQLSEKRGDLDQLMVNEYKSPVVDTFLSAIVGATSLEDVFIQMEYANRVAADRTKTTREVIRLAEQAQEKKDALEAKRLVVNQAAMDAEAAESAWEEKLVEMRPQIKQLRQEYFDQVAGKSGSEQLNAAIAYLEDVDGYTAEQKAILQAAYSTGYAGSNYCERWAEAVYRNAGVSIDSYISANHDAKANMKSDDLNAIPVGALVYGSGTSVPYGHVGICVAAGTGNHDALILDNEGSRSKQAVPLSEWGEWQSAYSYMFGQSGLYGWGYPDSIYLEPVAY